MLLLLLWSDFCRCVAHTLSSTTEFFTSGDDHSDWVFLAHRVKIENEPCLLLLLNGGLVLYLGSFSYCMEEFRPPTMQWGVSLYYSICYNCPCPADVACHLITSGWGHLSTHTLLASYFFTLCVCKIFLKYYKDQNQIKLFYDFEMVPILSLNKLPVHLGNM